MDWIKNLKPDIDETTSFYHSQFINEKIEIVFIDTSEELGKVQTQTINEFIKSEAVFFDKYYEEIIEYYRDNYSNYKLVWAQFEPDESVIEKYLPSKLNNQNIVKHIRPLQIYLGPEEGSENGYFGIVFDCSWDEEHGLGILINNWNITEIGMAEVGFGV